MRACVRACACACVRVCVCACVVDIAEVWCNVGIDSINLRECVRAFGPARVRMCVVGIAEVLRNVGIDNVAGITCDCNGCSRKKS